MKILLFFFFFFLNLFYLWLCWVFVSVRGLSPVAASGGHSSSQCADLSLSWPLLLRSTGSRRAGSVVVATGPAALRHVGSSQTRAQTRVPCVGRQILNHCATREAPKILLFFYQRSKFKTTLFFDKLISDSYFNYWTEKLSQIIQAHNRPPSSKKTPSKKSWELILTFKVWS